MSMYVSVERHDNGVAVLRFERPPVNAISSELAGELKEAANALAADATVKAVVVTGSDKTFAAGADVTEFETDGGMVRLPDAVKAAGFALSSIPRPVIAAITGYAFGAGLEISMSCDLRVMADNGKLGQPEILLGLFPGASGTQRLPRLVGAGRAKDIIFSGRPVLADEALAIGLVNRVVPAGEVLDTAVRWASELAQGAVVAMGCAKASINHGLDGSLEAGVEIEASNFARCFQTEDAKKGIRSFFEKGPGKATFTGQ